MPRSKQAKPTESMKFPSMADTFKDDDPMELPRSEMAEQAVLGSILLDASQLDLVCDFLSPDSFHGLPNKAIYMAIVNLSITGGAIDVVTVSQHLKEKGLLDAVGGRVYLTDLLNSIASSNVEHYAAIVRDKYLLREMIRAANKIKQQCYSEDLEAQDVLDQAERLIMSVGEQSLVQEMIPLYDALAKVYDAIDDRAKNQGEPSGLTTGFHALDVLTSGFQPTDFVLIAARPSMGKTAFAINIAEHVATELRRPVAIFSLEMSDTQLSWRLYSSNACIDSSRLKQGVLSSSDWLALANSISVLGSAPIRISDSPSLSLMQLRAQCRRVKAEFNDLGLVVIDYLQLMQTVGDGKNRNNEISDLSRGLKILARELNCPIVALSQLSRNVEQRADKRPMLSDLRDSGSLEQDADTVLFLYRDAYYNPSTDEPATGELIIAKQRNGPTGTVKLTYHAPTTRFLNKE